MTSTHLPYDPFTDFPPDLPDRLRPYLEELVEDVVTEIQQGIPEYARPQDDTYMRTLRTGAEQALGLLLDRMARPQEGWETVAQTYHGIGRGEANEGRSLDAFQQAMRTGARIAWRRINSLADEDLLPRSVLVSLGEAMLVHLDEIIEATAAGYTEARLRAAGELQRRRERLLDLLTADPPASWEAICDLARAAQWTVPRRVAVVLVDAPAQEGGAEPERPITPPEVLVRTDRRPVIMVVPDPDGPGRARAISLALRGQRAVIGPTVEVADGCRSERLAAEALDLAQRGVIPRRDVIRCEDHLSTLLLFRDEALLDALAERHMAPLEQVRAPHRYRLAETLLAWLRCGHNTIEVAKRLAVHPQTVRYRLRQLDELLGDRLQDPETLFELELVLRAQQLRRAAGGEAEATAPTALSPTGT
ncbi:helix-turn-helix domain-containing protein [Streptomyces sp. ODS28]|uniref:PucR family transcriptional regulator n=1 Tax=Streptomyces sp. ODS28 TaxID=3136688 RepID=UPI0031E70A19